MNQLNLGKIRNFRRRFLWRLYSLSFFCFKMPLLPPRLSFYIGNSSYPSSLRAAARASDFTFCDKDILLCDLTLLHELYSLTSSFSYSWLSSEFDWYWSADVIERSSVPCCGKANFSRLKTSFSSFFDSSTLAISL